MRCAASLRSTLRFAVLLAGLAAAHVFAQSAPGRTAVTITQTTGPRAILPTWGLSIRGEWPTQCLPALQNVALDGNDLRVDARSVLELCEHQSTPFAIDVNPALAMQRMALPAGVYHASFYAADGAQAQPKLRAFALVDRSVPGTPAIAPEAGFWWSTGPDHTLLSLELQGSQLSAAMLSYDAAGQPAWSFGSAAYDGRIAHIPLLRLAGGSDPFAAAAAMPHGDAGMTLDLQFATSARAQAWLSRTQADDGTLQMRTLELSRLPLAETADGSAWLGDWVLVADAGNAVPQRLRMDRFQMADAQHFQLASADGTLAVDCESGSASDSLPQSCTLHLADGSTMQFDSVAIARMDGKDASGAAIHLLRVTP